MRVHQRLMSGLIMVALAALASAADPPAGSFEEAVEIARQMDPEAALNMGRELRKRADQGDANATYDLATMLMMHGRFGPAANEKTIAEWDKIGDRRPASEWLFRAAEGGSQDAIEHVCAMAEDRLGPAALRERSKASCETLRKKYPAK
jgi:TPR repeat protein